MQRLLKKYLTSLSCIIKNENFLKQVAIAKRNLGYSSDELRDMQYRKIKELLCYAYDNCPYYREKYRKVGLTPDSITNIDSFRKIPVLTKSELRQNLDAIVSRCAEKDAFEEVYTSGTTGVPLRTYRDKSKTNVMNALYIRTIQFWGCDIGSKTAWMWGVPQESRALYDYRYQSRVRRFLKNETWFNAFDVTEENMRGFSKLLGIFKPDLIISHMSILSEFTHFLVNRKISIHYPRAIWITAEPSSYSQRNLVEKVFNSKTFDQYGTTEILHIAAECNERQGLHVHADSRFVEILNSNGSVMPAGQVGNVVITDLENRVMPLIRYKNGDISSWKGKYCRCGMKLPLMNRVEGRILDSIILRDGRRLYGHIFAQILHRHVRDMRQFQVHQIAIDKIVIRVVPYGTDLLGRFKDYIVKAMREYTGSLVDYSFEVVEEIKREKSGKLRYVKSDLHEAMA